MDLPTDFMRFPKMGRLFRDMVITEKLDGTNAQILIVPVRELCYTTPYPTVHLDDLMNPDAVAIFAGSRERWLMPGKQTDNYGFAAWVKENVEELKKLGPGRHFGEWWGAGIQRRYGQTEKIFSLFNTGRWKSVSREGAGVFYDHPDGQIHMGPRCVRVVPTLYRGPFSTETIEKCVNNLRVGGSYAAPGFENPEGIITYHGASRTSFKTTLKDDDKAKSEVTPETI